ncbi:hypothetical protein M3147_09655 [Agromyces mediolanus]|uniref:hypothetical protein n=1 Tax=Agromyces mediolanus TaxID=41986 RepID=UPI00203ADDEB|nr:hypothetical protein [Agromyces mediolanus]MCM3657514.1 hypothetical protein [Agromyces mediolanus]
MQVLLAYGPEARITEATRVTRKGLGRFLAHEEIEATVIVPDDAAPAGGIAPERVDRAGIAALLADADRADGGSGTAGPPIARGAAAAEPAAGPQASTSSRDFAALLADVERAIAVPPTATAAAAAGAAATTVSASASAATTAGTATPAFAAGGAELNGSPSTSGAPEPEASADTADPDDRPIVLEAVRPSLAELEAPEVPFVADRASAGDFVLVLGLGDDATTAARGLVGQAAGAPLLLHGRTADAAADIPDRRAALAARMRAVEQHAAVVLAVSVGLQEELTALAELRPDEVWVAVDVSRRTDDTGYWLARVDAALPISAIAAVGAERTRHPLDVSRFGPRVGWRQPPS